MKLGVFSLWKGQQALNSRPALMSFTDGPITADSVVRALSSSSQAGESVTVISDSGSEEAAQPSWRFPGQASLCEDLTMRGSGLISKD